MASNVPVGSSEYGMSNASNLRWGLPPANNPECFEKRHPFNGIPQRIKTVIVCGIFVHETCCSTANQRNAIMVRDRLLKLCSDRGEHIHLILNKYLSP